MKKVIIVGAGFGGLFAARTLANKEVSVLLIDRNNYHTFTPLLYQVATCALDPSEIAYPVRTIFRENRNVLFLLGEVTAVHPDQQTITVQNGSLTRQESYNYLILATGSEPTYFGKDEFRQFSLDLRTLDDAVELRNHILRLFERAAWTDDKKLCAALTTIVVVGGGPTGLETAGAIYELYNHVLSLEYTQSNIKARVVLVEMQPYLLASYPDDLRQAAQQQLESLGVEVKLGQPLVKMTNNHIVLQDGTEIPTFTLVWAAGVKGSASLIEKMGIEVERNGRVPITPSLTLKNHPNIYAIGDMAHLNGPDERPYPMLIPIAQQQGILAAQNILADINGRPAKTFTYHDRGIMATIGRRRAVVWLYNRLPMKGYLAWLTWLALHLLTLLGFRNRLNVFVNWVWNYFTYDRSVRLILEKADPPKQATSGD
ncbi:MAG: NAD(P)/FAD-dependent oxidoreductase [Ardenticatenaceae bacterium]|nr:NAD(P)/FAD-dependent oxidoreductase [Ardenticatenaceae bacterium]MCB9443832.1 NAD(P)/FAD-dependent oxidoreductase [Ardenticatenaceae bacterium]